MKSEKRDIVRKFVFAESAAEAIKKDKDTPVTDVFIDQEWESERLKQVGFKWNPTSWF